MQIGIRAIGVGALATLGFGVAQAHAGMMLAGAPDNLPGFSLPWNTAETVNGQTTALAQQFTLEADSTLESVSLFGFSPNGAPLDVSITTAVGPGASPENVMGSFDGVEVDETTGFGASYHDVDIPDTTLAAGDYWLVVSSPEPDGFEWRRLENEDAVNLGLGGIAQFDDDDDFLGEEFALFEGELRDTFAAQFFGSVVPAPGPLAIAAMGGAMTLVRRRR